MTDTPSTTEPFYAVGRSIFRRPDVRTVGDRNSSILGFRLLTLDEDFDTEQATAVADLLNLGQAAKDAREAHGQTKRRPPDGFPVSGDMTAELEAAGPIDEDDNHSTDGADKQPRVHDMIYARRLAGLE